ncbi:Galactose oxidase/kelch repeat superfamily protein [Perilla frutescens var. frutescens]|nr:Galactose oxidase/kelch repeat superfamily protein [Perilla frutescens var. frutescens]
MRRLSPKLKLVSGVVDPALIPGVPDDVGLECLVRVSVDNHAACKAVCKRWYNLFSRKEQFFTRRRELGFRDPWLYVLAFDKCSRKMEWRVLDLIRFSWHTMPMPMPCTENVSPHGFNCVAIPHEGVLYVCGGVITDADCPLNLVLKYEVLKNRWTAMKKMSDARSFFASGMIDGMVYVAGGNGPQLFELGSGEVFDPKTGVWKPIANMCTNMASYDSAVVDGKLLVTEGWFWPFYARPMGQSYDPSTDKWDTLAPGLREGWTGSSVVIYQHLFVVTEHEPRELKVYHTETDSWSLVEGPTMPHKICKPFCVSSWESKIYVVGQNLHVAVANVLRNSSSQNKCRFSVQWQLVDDHDAHTLFHLTPSNAQLLLA